MLNCWVVLKSTIKPIAHRVFYPHRVHHVGHHHAINHASAVKAAVTAPSVPETVCSAVGSPFRKGLFAKPFAFLPPAIIGGALLVGPSSAPVYGGGGYGGLYGAGGVPALAQGGYLTADYSQPVSFAVPGNNQPALVDTTQPSAMQLTPNPIPTASGTGGPSNFVPFIPPGNSIPGTSVPLPPGTNTPGNTTPGETTDVPEPSGFIMVLSSLVMLAGWQIKQRVKRALTR